MTNIDISQENINTIFLRFKNELPQLELLWQNHNGQAETGYFEGKLTYVLIREYKPEIIFEFGPNYGFSTYPLALAVRNNGFGKIYSFEKDVTIIDTLARNLEKAKLKDLVTIVPGDIRDTSPNILKDIGKIDILFVDNGHEDYMAEWYIPNLFPHVKQLAFVHDMTYGTPNPQDEKHVVFEFLNKNPKYPNVLVKDYYNNTIKDYYYNTIIERKDGPGGSANSGIWIDMSIT